MNTKHASGVEVSEPRAEKYVPACLRNLPPVKRQRTKPTKAERERSTAIIAALQDVYRELQWKAKETRGWAPAYASAMSVIEAQIAKELP